MGLLLPTLRPRGQWLGTSLETELTQRPENRKHMPQHLKSTWIDPGWELALGGSNYQEAQTLTALKVQAAEGLGWVVKHTGKDRPVLDLGYKLHQLRLLLKHDSLEHQVSSQAIVCSCLPVFNSCGTYQLWSSTESVACTAEWLTLRRSSAQRQIDPLPIHISLLWVLSQNAMYRDVLFGRTNPACYMES